MYGLRQVVTAGLAAIIFLVAAGPPDASAHSGLLRSLPAAGAVLEMAPRQVVMTFTEEPDLRASEARVIRADGSAIVPAAELALSDPVTLQFPLPELEDGTYTVAWRTVSTVDGHPAAGTIPFAVGLAGQAPAAAPAALLAAGGPPRLLLATGKFVSYATFSLLMLLALALPIIVLPALAAAGAGAEMTRRRVAVLRRGAVITTAILLAASAALSLFLQAWTNGGQADAFFSDTSWTLLRSTRFGTTWLVRVSVSMAAAALLVGLVARAEPSGDRGRQVKRWMYLPVAIAALVLPLTLSWNSHFAATDSRAYLGALGDGIHTIAATVWLGGLAALAVLAATGRTDETAAKALRLAMRRFSMVAGVAVAVLFVSGIAAWWRLVGNAGDTVSTGYGRLILLKTALLVLMLALAAVHLAHGHAPAVASRLHAEKLASIRRTVALEAVLGLCAVAAAALLSATPPPAEGSPATVRGSILRQQVDDIEVELNAAPLVAGQNALAVELSGSGATRVEHVILRLNYLDEDLGMADADAAPAGPERYVVQGSQLSLPGHWEVTVILHRTNLPEARVTFRVTVARG